MEALLSDFFWRAVLGGLGVAVVAGPLGCFVVWRRMAYYGDSLAHGALLGVALGIALDVGVNAGTLLVFAGLVALLLVLQGQRTLATDTVLGILAHSALSLGLVIISFLPQVRVDLMGYLFGDILAVTRGDLGWIFGGGTVALAVLVWLWPHLLRLTIHEELAQAEGVPVWAARLGLMLLVALVIVVAMKIIGILLITSLLIIPPAAARPFAGSPERMALLAAAIGALAVIAGLGASLTWDTPSGPSVVVAAAALFALSVSGGAGLRALHRGSRTGRP